MVRRPVSLYDARRTVGCATLALTASVTVVLLGCSKPTWFATNSGDATLVAREDTRGHGTAQLYIDRRKTDLCLKIVRRWEPERRLDRWRTCGLAIGGADLDVHTRISCAAGEMHYLGVAPRRTRRLVGELSNGRRIATAPRQAPAALGVRAKLFMVVLRFPSELGWLRAVGPHGGAIDSTVVHLIRGPRCGPSVSAPGEN